jgi:hypothetical protein
MKNAVDFKIVKLGIEKGLVCSKLIVKFHHHKKSCPSVRQASMD